MTRQSQMNDMLQKVKEKYSDFDITRRHISNIVSDNINIIFSDHNVHLQIGMIFNQRYSLLNTPHIRIHHLTYFHQTRFPQCVYLQLAYCLQT